MLAQSESVAVRQWLTVCNCKWLALHYGKSPRQLKVQDILTVDPPACDCATCKGNANISSKKSGHVYSYGGNTTCSA